MVAAIKLFGATITLEDGLIHDHDIGMTKKETSSEDQGTEGDRLKKPNQIIPCPRCKSMETKFCYFNNYNVNQPRHFCKGCHRYWTAGGALHNVGCSKSKPSPSAPHPQRRAAGDWTYDHRHGYDRRVEEQGRVQQQQLGIKRKWSGSDCDG
ncbi:hypothetical protein MLD38_039929 [Melastoma candidum]|uniref:Uncharacterized protein n=1 Tax=Melastoma candidum TaxID=119954 RepID=A0ACB9L4J8_9MYRT|nr:hypothetical protein MLD38_039929 [Melastoma candidum]